MSRLLHRRRRRRVRGRHPHGVGVVPAGASSAPPRASTAAGATSAPPPPPSPCRSSPTSSAGPTAGAGRSACTGVIAAALRPRLPPRRRRHPRGRRLRPGPKASALEVTSRRAVFGLVALSVPLVGALGVIAWRIWEVGRHLARRCSPSPSPPSPSLLGIQVTAVLPGEPAGPARRRTRPTTSYPFRSVAVLSPRLRLHLRLRAGRRVLPARRSSRRPGASSTAVAGAAASAFAVMNLVSRPGRRPPLGPASAAAAAGSPCCSAASALGYLVAVPARRGAGRSALAIALVLRDLAVRPGGQRRRLRHRAAGEEAGERPDRRPGRRLRQRRRHRLPHHAAVPLAPGGVPGDGRRLRSSRSSPAGGSSSPAASHASGSAPAADRARAPSRATGVELAPAGRA